VTNIKSITRKKFAIGVTLSLFAYLGKAQIQLGVHGDGFFAYHILKAETKVPLQVAVFPGKPAR
jgi:hypothetical protein